METEYDVIIMGAGVAGGVAASKLARAGMKIAVIELREYGGTCALRGCVPKKVLTGVAELVDLQKRFGNAGVVNPENSIDWEKLMELKRGFVDFIPEQREKGFGKMGIATYHGRAHFAGPDTVAVGEDRFRGKHILVAVGAVPRKLGIPGEEWLATSDDFLELKALPRRIVFAGGGYISFEFAHLAARAGAEVIILQRSYRVLRQFDPKLTGLLVKATEEAGIGVLTGRTLEAVEKAGEEFIVTASTPEGRETFTCDLVVHGSGRVAATDGLDADKGGVELEKGGVVVNEFMQSISNPRVYAGGDCVGVGALLTPVASLQGTVAASNMLTGNSRTVDYTGIPSTVFTIPALAGVGISPEDDDDRYDIIFHDMSSWYTARRLLEKYSASRVIVDKATGKIAGAHILGTEAPEVINLFAMAMRLGIPVDEFRRVVYVFPTMASDIQYMIRR